MLLTVVVLISQPAMLLAAAYAFGLGVPIGGVALAVVLVAVGAAFVSASKRSRKEAHL